MASARILIILDNRLQSELYRDILEKEGYKIELSGSGPATLKKISREHFDLVIADIVLKDNSGLAFLSLIKKEKPSQDIIIVADNQSVKKAVEALQMGASDYLPKPVEEKELLFSIRRILERQVASQEHSKLISENIHFYELMRIQKRNLSLLAITSLDRLVEAILDNLHEELKAPGGTFFLREVESGKYTPVSVRGQVDEEKTDAAGLFKTDALRSTLENGRPLLESADGDQWIPKGNDEGSRLIFPVKSGPVTLGAVKLAARTDGRSYDHFDIDLGKNILEAAGLALYNAQSIATIEKQHILGQCHGTYTPAYFRNYAEAQLNIVKRYNRETSLLLLQLANYQSISQGVKEKQMLQLLDHFCGTILEIVRETDVISRLDKDLFGIVVPETDFYGAIMLKKRIKMKLDKTTYSLDLKRDVIPRINVGCASSPKDGYNYHGLMIAARERLNNWQRSFVSHLRLKEHDLWKIVGSLIRPGGIEKIQKKFPDQETSLRAITLPEESFQVLTRSLIKDLESFCPSRGLLYLGIGTMDPNSPIFYGTPTSEGARISVFAMGAKGPNLWSLSHVTPVFINDDQLTRHLFILGLAEDFYYALFCHRNKQSPMIGFHTSDEHLVLELVASLQEHYLLQRRIG